MFATLRNRFSNSPQFYEELLINESDNDKSDAEPVISQDLVIPKAVDANERTKRQVVEEVAKNIVLRIIESAHYLHFVGSFNIHTIYQKLKSCELDPSRYELMKEMLGEFLPKNLLKISEDKKELRIVISDHKPEQDSESGLLLSQSQIIEMRSKSRAATNERLESLVKETSALLNKKMSNDGISFFSKSQIVVDFPFSINEIPVKGITDDVVKAFEIILQKSFPDRKVSVTGVTPSNEKVCVTLGF